MAGRDLARGVRVVARLATGAEIAPDQPEIGPLGNRLDVVDRVRRGQHALAQAPPAERVGFQLREAQRFPRCVIPARRGRAAPAIELRASLRHAADRRLVDKVHTATELEFLTREATAGQERVGPRLRFSLNVAIVEAVHGLYDPNYRRQFKPHVLKKIDAGVRAALDAGRQAQGEAVVNLEKGVRPGEGDDFPDLNDRECPQCHRFINQSKCPHCGTENPQAGINNVAEVKP